MKSPSKIVVESFTGYRIWEITEDGRLFSVLNNIEWPMREPSEAAPLVFYSEGIHAWATPQEAWCAFDKTCDDLPHANLVVGAVALWGDVAFDHGVIRATRAYPLSLWTNYDHETNGYIARAAQRYGVDVIPCPLQAYEVA